MVDDKCIIYHTFTVRRQFLGSWPWHNDRCAAAPPTGGKIRVVHIHTAIHVGDDYALPAIYLTPQRGRIDERNVWLRRVVSGDDREIVGGNNQHIRVLR